MDGRAVESGCVRDGIHYCNKLPVGLYLVRVEIQKERFMCGKVMLH